MHTLKGARLINRGQTMGRQPKKAGCKTMQKTWDEYTVNQIMNIQCTTLTSYTHFLPFTPNSPPFPPIFPRFSSNTSLSTPPRSRMVYKK